MQQEQQRKAHEEEMRKKKLAEMQAKEEQMRRMREMEQKRKQEQATTLLIRQAQQKVRLSTPETFEALNTELQQLLQKDGHLVGNQLQKITEECQKVVEDTKKRIDGIVEQRRIQQEKKDAEEKKRKEQEEKAQGFIKELTDLIEAAEAGSEKLKETAEPMKELGEKDAIDEAAMDKVMDDVNAAATKAKELSAACTAFILEKGPEMKETINAVPASANLGPIVPGAVAPTGMKQLLAQLLQRINTCGKSTDAHLQAGKAAKEEALRKVSARKKTKELEKVFAKYDKDKDKVLSEAEVMSYVKSELKCACNKELLAKIMKTAVDEGGKGVSFENFYLVSATVGMQREFQRNAERKAEREAREKVVAEMKDKLKDKVKQVRTSAQTLEKELSSIEKAVAPLLAKAKSTPLADAKKEAGGIDKTIKAVQGKADKVKKQVEGIPQGLDDKHEAALRECIKQDIKHLELLMSRNDLRLNRALNLTKTYCEKAECKQAAEAEKVRAFAMKIVRQHAKLNNLSMDELFGKIDKNKDQKIDEKEFLSFFASIDKELKDEEEEEEEEKETEKTEPTASQTEEAKAETEKEGDDKPEGEAKVLPVGPVGGKKEEAAAPVEKTPLEQVDLTPAALKALFSNALESGSKALSKEVFERLATVFCRVTQDTPITKELEVTGDNAVRSLKANEIVALLEGPKKANGKLRRAKCRATTDGAEGWVTYNFPDGRKILVEGAHLFKTMKATHLCDSFDSTEAKDGVRRLKQGEVLEVLQMPKKDEETGAYRMEVRTRLGALEGWLTQVDKDGVIFAEPL